MDFLKSFFEVHFFLFFFLSLLMDTMVRFNHYMKCLALIQNRNPFGGSFPNSFRQIHPIFISFLSYIPSRRKLVLVILSLALNRKQ
jgi:hypothetical protein